MGDGFLHKLGAEIEKTLDAVEPTGGDPQGLDVARVAAGAEPAGDHSPVVEDPGFKGD